MGEVWLAYDQELYDRPVAIKMMHSHMLTDAQDVARFQREMRLASRMQHPNIMTVFTTGSDNGVPFMVMEYLEGQDLGKMPTGHRADEVARIGRETCMALAYAHGLGVVHRDIKPGNLFVCDTGLVKVTDFGIAKAVTGTKLSATGTLIGTFPYIAPEQWLGMPAAFSNDIWAVGCVLYEMLSGRVPRSYATATEYFAAAARHEAVPPLKAPDVPQWIINAVMAMLQPDPSKRPTVAQCLQLLSKPPAPAAPVPVPPVPPARPTQSPYPRASQSAPASSRPIPRAGVPTSTAHSRAPSNRILGALVALPLSAAYICGPFLVMYFIVLHRHTSGSVHGFAGGLLSLFCFGWLVSSFAVVPGLFSVFTRS